MKPAYTILGSVWYTPPITNIIFDGMFGIGQHLSVGVVAIKSSDNKWKAYLGYGVTGEQWKDEQHIATNGVKITKAVACATFPKLDPKRFIF